jgi:hypothetical protein
MSTNKLVSAEMAAFAAAFLRLLLVIATLSGHDFFPSNGLPPAIKQLSLSSHITSRGPSFVLSYLGARACAGTNIPC